MDDMNVAELRQEVSENHNTIYKLRKNTEPNKRQQQSNWQGGRRGLDPQQAEQPGPKAGVRVPEGVAKGAKLPQKSPAKAQAHIMMLRTSLRSSDSDEELMYERACLVRPRENIDRQTEPMDKDMDQEVDSLFSITQIKTLIMDEEPASERANLIRTRLEPEKQLVQSGLTKSEPIMIEPDIITSCAVGEPKA